MACCSTSHCCAAAMQDKPLPSSHHVVDPEEHISRVGVLCWHDDGGDQVGINLVCVLVHEFKYLHGTGCDGVPDINGCNQYLAVDSACEKSSQAFIPGKRCSTSHGALKQVCF